MEPKLLVTFILKEDKLNPKNTVKQVIKMPKEAYDNIVTISTEAKYNRVVTKSKDKPIRVWDTMGIKDRIRKHLQLIAHDLNAKDFSFEILE